LLDTRDEESCKDFLQQKKPMVDRLSALSQSLKDEPTVLERIRAARTTRAGAARTAASSLDLTKDVVALS